jgi:4-diphosphocytidyl-2-C-methyl-D-erythritol kinase
MPSSLEKKSPCKVNLLLNILGRRPDGFHELETIMQPVGLHDTLTFERAGCDVHLSCSDASLPAGSGNLVHRAATAFLEATGIRDGFRIHLEKRIPLAAGLGGGSGNAATTLLGLNELCGSPLSFPRLEQMAGALGSDVPFFLQDQPALATGRGERVEPLAPFQALSGAWMLLIHPGFGVATAWAYKHLARFPAAFNGQPGRAQKLIALLRTADLERAGREFYNSLEAPVLEKFPLLALFQEFLRSQGMPVALMSGSGSTTFAMAHGEAGVRKLENQMQSKFGPCWTAVVEVGG